MIARVLHFPRRNRAVFNRCGNVITRRPVPTVASVLGYLDRMRLYAEKAHDRDAAALYERAWREYLELTHGPLPPRQPSPIAVMPAHIQGDRQPAKRKLRQVVRPMRSVVSRRELNGRRSVSGFTYTIVELRLECGHVVEELGFMLGDKPAFRRRCAECAESGHRVIG